MEMVRTRDIDDARIGVKEKALTERSATDLLTDSVFVPYTEIHRHRVLGDCL